MKNLFEQNILIEFGDSDPQGILYFANTYKLAHQCLETYWAQNELGWKFWFQNPEFAVPIRHSECDYLAPMKAGENYKSTLMCSKIGDSSVEFSCSFSNLSDDTVCATVKTVHVFVDRKSFNKISVPERIRISVGS
ncbi:MAG: acyl-CoA thioesterase [Bdellovibrionales bacterium]|nr:acyl-CoA thioesterase [Bdellovibrionales bacterium]